LIDDGSSPDADIDQALRDYQAAAILCDGT